MTESGQIEWTGGCQCGAVRYEFVVAPQYSSICHCRMCQRASGQPFMAFTGGRVESLRWTRGQPTIFESSNVATRGFCAHCGTPLTYQYDKHISVTVCSLDHPELAPPTIQYGIESELPWTAGLPHLPRERTEKVGPVAAEQVVSYQYDPDTDRKS